MSEHTDPVDAVDEQPTLPDLELPEYHGQKPVGMKSALTGAGTRIRRPYGIGDRVVLVVEAKVKKAGHEETDDGLVYVETLKVSDLFELDRDPGTRLLRFLRSNYRVAEDKVAGRAPLADNGTDLGDEGWTDGNGVVLTPSELAERRGDPVAFLTSAEHTPAVVVYADGTRLLWPDEYPQGVDRPSVGDDLDDGTVVELLHHATGETIAELLDSDEVDTDGPFDDVAEWEGSPADHRHLTVVDDQDDDETADDGGYGDVEPYDAPATGKPSGETPALPGEEELAARLPDAASFAWVDVTVPKLREKLAEVADLPLLRRFLESEKQGRGKGAPARKGALDAIHARIAEVEGGS